MSCSPASGSTFPYGTTTVSCGGVTDSHGNTPPADPSRSPWNRTNAPSVTVSSGITVEANGPKAASRRSRTLPTRPTTRTVPSPAPCKPGSGSTFKLGKTSVTCSATDSDGNSARVVRRHGRGHDTAGRHPAGGSWIQTTDRASVRAPVRSRGSSEARPPRTSSMRSSRSRTTRRRRSRGVDDRDVHRQGRRSQLHERNGDRDVVAPGTPIPASTDRTPPGNVRALRANPGNRSAIFSWKNRSTRTSPRRDHTRAREAGRPALHRLQGQEDELQGHRAHDRHALPYLLVAYDKAGNRSAGVAVVVSDASNSSSPPRRRHDRKAADAEVGKGGAGRPTTTCSSGSSRPVAAALPRPRPGRRSTAPGRPRTS